MKIVDVQTYPLMYMKDAPKIPRTFLLCKVTTDEGLFGWGEASSAYGHSYPLVVKEIIDHTLKRLTFSGSCTAEPVTPPASVSSSRLAEEAPAFSAVVTGFPALSPRNAPSPSRYASHVMTAPPSRYSRQLPSVLSRQ